MKAVPFLRSQSLFLKSTKVVVHQHKCAKSTGETKKSLMLMPVGKCN